MKKLTLMALASGLAIAAAAPVNAAIFISYSTDGGATKTTLTASASGSAGYTNTIGQYSFNLGANGAPLLTSPDFTTNSIDIQSAGGSAGTLIVYFTQTGNTTFNGTLGSAFTSNVLSGSAQNVTISSYYNSTNANGALTGVSPGTLLQSKSFTGIGTFTGGNTLSVAGPFSTTVAYSMTFGAGGGRFNDTADLTAVPEPATWGMMVLGFGVVGSAMRRRNAKTIASFA